MALTVLKPSYKSEMLNNISNQMQLCYSENAVNYIKKYWAMGAASHVDLGAEGDVRPPATMQQH